MAVLQWGTLIVCGLATVVRIPDALRGRNRTVFGILFLATLCSLLSIPEPYLAIDGALGSWNLTNLILRFFVFGMVFLVGVRLAKGLGAARARRLITGAPGRWGRAAACLAVTVTFVLMDTGGSSAGLEAQSDDSGLNAALAPFYAAAGRSYPAFVSLIMLPPLAAAIGTQLPWLVRAGAAMTLVGAAAAIVSVPASFAPDPWDPARMLVNYVAVLGYVLGLLIFWLSGRIAAPPDNTPATFRKN
ncbi:hypothetical protein E7Y32_02165 [Arthrobacter sp. UKPF54-2]|uniref:hypothetical protein n=1 Tax=Arthrobacter sp. UKPF54-2 TaxID=2600159 RepID=UPI0011B16028|nr:hypothetical protein [Arthrobacter sp. UKPF54-2]QDY89153.1 hypothetical protein E7Y32_02165 [Arthrobacter sp. UKPF54-2]